MADFTIDLPDDQKAQFDRAVSAFSGEDSVCVTAEKLKAFLQATDEIDQPPANRLRWLAVELDYHEFEDGWHGLQAIYKAAAAADPTDALVLHSWGISAINWFEDWKTADLSERVAIAAEAERVLRKALKITPQDSSVAYALGLVFYEHPAHEGDADKYRSEALKWFDRAVNLDRGNVLAQLFVAHCFHDSKDWPDAIAAYEKVDLVRLARDWPAWRAVKCREQLAQCYAYSGNREEAIDRFSAFLDDADSWDDDTIEENIVNVDELVATVTNILDDPALLNRTRALVERLGHQTWYKELFDQQG